MERISRVNNLPETCFTQAAPGFVVVDGGRAGEQDAVVIRVIESDRAGSVFEMRLPSAD